jgi:hypothetical protein
MRARELERGGGDGRGSHDDKKHGTRKYIVPRSVGGGDGLGTGGGPMAKGREIAYITLQCAECAQSFGCRIVMNR